MSKIIKNTGYRPLSHVVETVIGTQYLVSSAFTLDNGLETMVFLWNAREDGVEKWSEEYVEWHRTEREMAERHKWLCENLETVLEGAGL